MGLYHRPSDWDWREVDERFKEAIRLNPRSAQVRPTTRSTCSAWAKTAALEETQRAEEAAPYFQIAITRAAAILRLRSSVRPRIRLTGEEHWNSIRRTDSPSLRVVCVFSTGTARQRDCVGVESGAKSRRAYGPFSSALGTAYGLAGRCADALGVIQELRDRSKQHYIPTDQFRHDLRDAARARLGFCVAGAFLHR